MNELINNLYALFDAAYKQNMNNKGTDITKMITSFIPSAIQKLQALRDGYDYLLIAIDNDKDKDYIKQIIKQVIEN